MSWKRYWQRGRRDDDFDREVESYLLHEIDRGIDAGLSPDQARTAAYRKFGNVTAMKERVHEMNTIGLLDAFLHDLKYGLRWLRLNPGFAAVAVLSLAVGMGANTAIFQLVDALRIRPLPVPAPSELVRIRVAPPDGGRTGRFTGQPDLTYPQLERIRERQHAFSDVLAWSTQRLNLSTGGEVRNANAIWVSGEFFNMLGVAPQEGRLIGPNDDVRGCSDPGVVLSYPYWQSEYGAQGSAIGRSLTLAGRTFPIIGVARRGFFGVEVGRQFDVALPLCAKALLPGDDPFVTRAYWWLGVIGRLKSGQTLKQAEADLEAISPALFEDTLPANYSANDSKNYLQFKLQALSAETGVSSLRNTYETPLWILLATTSLVLLIACANIANLMLARASARQREISIRLAIGASRWRVVRQLFAESLLLASISAGLGVVIARNLSSFLIAFLSSRNNQMSLPLDMNWHILGYMCLLIVATCFIFGLAPALRGTRVGPGAAMKASGRGLSANAERFALRRALVIAQVGLSLVLVIGALLFARSLRNIESVDSGFQPEGLLMATIDLQRSGYAEAQRGTMFQQILDRIRKLPGVTSAAETEVRWGLDGWNDNVRMQGNDPSAPYVLSNFNRIGQDYFKTMGMSLLAGRDFNPSDTTSSPDAAIIDEQFAHRVFGEANPIGRSFEIETAHGGAPQVYEIIGIVQNALYHNLRDSFEPTAYLATGQRKEFDESINYVLRAGGQTSAVIPFFKEAIRQINPQISIDFFPVDAVIRNALVRDRLMATLSTFFGVIAGFLATLGIYGTLSYSVSQRRNEIGIRMALGANQRQVVRMIFGEAIVLLLVGLILGTAAALTLTRTTQTLLFGLQPNDPVTIATAITALAFAALCASYLPARRASNVEPATVLREE
jgi:putative ABC transport system permease protein